MSFLNSKDLVVELLVTVDNSPMIEAIWSCWTTICSFRAGKMCKSLNGRTIWLRSASKKPSKAAVIWPAIWSTIAVIASSVEPPEALRTAKLLPGNAIARVG